MGIIVGAAGAQARSFETSSMRLGPIEVVADRSGALFVPHERTLVVADLHLEKGSAFAARGILLPPYDTRETLRRLRGVIGRYRPARVVALGDSLHDRGAEARLGAADLDTIHRLQANLDWVWITGNHDPEITTAVGGRVCATLTIAGITLRHEPTSGECGGEIAGHLHPVARVVRGGAAMRRPCFVGDEQRLILPAFGAFTGGLNVLDRAFVPHFAGRFEVHVLGRDGVYPVARASLGSD